MLKMEPWEIVEVWAPMDGLVCSHVQSILQMELTPSLGRLVLVGHLLSFMKVEAHS